MFSFLGNRKKEKQKREQGFIFYGMKEEKRGRIKAVCGKGNQVSHGKYFVPQ